MCENSLFDRFKIYVTSQSSQDLEDLFWKYFKGILRQGYLITHCKVGYFVAHCTEEYLVMHCKAGYLVTHCKAGYFVKQCKAVKES